jgi:hypothetical protein
VRLPRFDIRQRPAPSISLSGAELRDALRDAAVETYRASEPRRENPRAVKRENMLERRARKRERLARAAIVEPEVGKPNEGLHRFLGTEAGAAAAPE